MPERVAEFPELLDFYNSYDELKATGKQIKTYKEFLEGLSEEQLRLLKTDLTFYLVDITNEGGLPMPVILKLTFADGSTEEVRLPAEIWRANARKVTKSLLRKKEDREDRTRPAPRDRRRGPRRQPAAPRDRGEPV